ncbi:signal recognition particle subunit Srp21 [Schizosaccharomyces cryophilus OY26]|uniref:Signal recognition particle subunit Srp21 n=1 Tax=Schizosaccharomyces cryophilus (strain OY26 / ATCC MYA-4695 / CBS 11777 / NBRC 106824 / NRRL Y48691) TaxID=653667 RepID=S9VV82_SCHCR|nr:signal recognition particle subunit Srp21 [Schizosaccharomyces cryophilus OY26]EPY51693.1 signal recognition particle subunit Srp21 [Schizosaccharomyces cryophilus OY26]
MVYLSTVNDFFEQTKLLVEAYPDTTKLTTRYRIDEDQQSYLVAKAYESTAGICLKFRTDKAAELSRLMLIASKLGYVSNKLEIPPEPSETEPAAPNKPVEVKSEPQAAPSKSSKKKKKGKKK